MTTRTGDIGNCYEYTVNGRRLAGTDRMTIDNMVKLSANWPETWHQYVGPNGYQTWAHRGRELAGRFLPWELAAAADVALAHKGEKRR